jgi:hypothetical protein
MALTIAENGEELRAALRDGARHGTSSDERRKIEMSYIGG